MVRFIMRFITSTSQTFSTIYIPIWLDLLYKHGQLVQVLILNLHSNMVRFIILIEKGHYSIIPEFTFQYG